MAHLTRLLPAACVVALVVQPGYAQTTRYAGRPLADVLIELRAAGVNVVFSSELVRPEMRVQAEPRSEDPRRMLNELLKPHGLIVRELARGRLTIVRQRPPATPPAAEVAPVGTIAGRVIDARSGAPLSGGQVQIESTGQHDLSDGDGRFEITAVPAGSQRVLVSLVGYALVRRDLDVSASKTTELVVALAEGAGTYEETVTVTASSYREGEVGVAHQAVLGSRDLQALRGVLADDPMRAVQALPGVTTGDDARAEFAVRGHGPDHLGVSVDGIDSRLLFHTVRGTNDTGSIGLINSDILESVAVVAGARPQRMHGSLGAAVDFVTRDGASDRLRIRGLLSATAASTVWEGPAGARATWLVAARQSYIDWVLRRIDSGTGATFGFTDAQAKVRWSPSPRHTIRALVLGGRSMLHEREQDPDPNSLDSGANRVVAASLQWRFAPSNQLAVTQQLYFVDASYRNVTPAGSVREEGADRDLTWRGGIERIFARGRFEAGAQAQHVQVDRAARQFMPFATVDVLSLSGHATNVAGWLNTSWSVTPRLTVSPGMRVDHSELTGSTSASPWLLGEWRVGERTRIRAGAALHHQIPRVEQGQLVEPGVTLEPERSRSWDVGIERAFADDWRIGVDVYHRRENDVLRLIGAEPFVEDGSIVRPGDPHWENALSGKARGAGVRLERRSANGLSGWLTCSFDRADLTDAARHESFPADFDQRHTVNAYGTYRWSGRTALSAKWRYGSNFPLVGYYQRQTFGYFLSTERNRERLPMYSRLDVRAERTFTRQRSRLTLYVEVLNLLNRDNLGPGDANYNVITGRVSDLVEEVFPLLPSAGLLIEF
jgi:hypothetical protein